MKVGESGWQQQSGLIVSTLRGLLGQALTGVYIHGSAAMGGWNPASDLDVLVTTDADAEDWRAVGYTLLEALDPVPVVELSIVSDSAAAVAQPPWPFLVHVDHSDGSIVTDDQGIGDSDLLMHFLVARHSGIALIGPAPQTAFGEVPRAAVLSYLKDELAWALENADQRYGVLNACRALAYCREGLVLSKTAGGQWALARGEDRRLIVPSLDAQATGQDLGAPTSAGRSLIQQCLRCLEKELTGRQS